MKAATASSHDATQPAPLCPACRAPVVSIDTSVEVKYQVHYAITAQDLEVIAEQIGESGWDENTTAECGACGWHGTVGDLLVRR